MNTVVATAMVWTTGSLVSATLALSLVEISTSQFDTLARHMAAATGDRADARKPERAAFGKLFDGLSATSSERGFGAAAIDLSRRFADLVTAPVQPASPRSGTRKS